MHINIFIICFKKLFKSVVLLLCMGIFNKVVLRWNFVLFFAIQLYNF
jgi:hypothetical protein